ncbi:hypothetical protein NW762_000858 [Fusarium torreyae]|uniref:Uncharacterized protein n=1 Tax=Fusarium torreyae TaxID=1237075 RepID=A0A9W8SK92_9HYPO|nr:hypothetical protein NW762_000858 [Fusarium torreyae]
MARDLRDHDTRECDADQVYYSCSHYDFEFAGCCSHNPCIKPRGCRDNAVFIDPSLWPASDMFEGWSTVTESTATETESTLVPRRKMTATASMDEDDEETSLAPRTTAPTRTMTDSGTTRTIPNSHVVTMTHHTVIVTGKLPSPSIKTSIISSPRFSTDEFPFSTASFESTAIESPTETSTPSPSPKNGSNGSPSIGVIVGGVVGGIAVLALVTLAIFFQRRRRLRKAAQYDAGDMSYNFEKNEHNVHLNKMLSRNTTQRTYDPFAPFGGRADRVDDPLRPPSGTFEMDGTSNVPVELPAVTFSDARPRESQPADHQNATPAGYPTATGSSMDPRANLNASLEDRQQKQFVNHWNQYRALGNNVRQG